MSGKSSQIFGVILFIALGVSAIALGIKQYRQKLSSPFAVNADMAAAARAQLAAEGKLAPADDPSSKTDTDSDGLTDYEEAHLYRTSPYLKDSDSDGTSDSDEVKKGTDPNCPEGKTCENQLPANNEIPSMNSNQPSLDTGMNINDLVNQSFNTTGAGTGESSVNVGTPSADDIRAMLINAGLDQQSLEGISDADLIQLYNESLAEMAANANSNAP